MKKYIFFFPPWTAAEAKEEMERIEQMHEERRIARRLAFEQFLIRARADQRDREKRQQIEHELFERREWDATLDDIRMTYQAYDFE